MLKTSQQQAFHLGLVNILNGSQSQSHSHSHHTFGWMPKRAKCVLMPNIFSVDGKYVEVESCVSKHFLMCLNIQPASYRLISIFNLFVEISILHTKKCYSATENWANVRIYLWKSLDYSRISFVNAMPIESGLYYTHKYIYKCTFLSLSFFLFLFIGFKQNEHLSLWWSGRFLWYR